jgi:vacuolar-type H+-ATPase subunit C/Vma6
MEISGLTPNQVAMLDEMWACDSLEEFEEFLSTLDPAERLEALSLQRLVLLEALDEHVAKMPQYPDAARVIVDIMGK